MLLRRKPWKPDDWWSYATGGSTRPNGLEWVDEPVPGYPKRPVSRGEDAAKALKKRTLTNLYNARPQWLGDAHDALDAVVAARVRLVGGHLRRRRSPRVAGAERHRYGKWLTCGGSLACLALLAGGGAERAGGLVRTGPQTSKAVAGGCGPGRADFGVPRVDTAFLRVGVVSGRRVSRRRGCDPTRPQRAGRDAGCSECCVLWVAGRHDIRLSLFRVRLGWSRGFPFRKRGTTRESCSEN